MKMETNRAIFAPNFKAEPFWWEAARPYESIVALPGQSDVVIVGSGFCGLSAALTCLDAGQSTLVLDAGPVGGMASSRSGAAISMSQKMLLTGASRQFTEEQLKEAIRLHAEAFEMVKSLSADEGLQFDFQQSGRLFLAAVPNDAPKLREHAEIFRTRAQLTTRTLTRDELVSEIGSTIYHGGMLVKEFGTIHPSKFGRALAGKVNARAGVIASHTRVTGVRREGRYFFVETDKGAIKAGYVLFATNGYSDSALNYVKRRTAAVESQIIATEPLSPAVMRSVMPSLRVYSDSKRSLWYFRPSPEGDRVLFGARPGAFPLSIERSTLAVHANMLRVFPQLEGVKVTHSWSGNVAMTSNRFQHIGSINGIYYAVGCNGSGVAIMPYLGKVAAERMLGIRTKRTLFEAFSFERFPPYKKYPWFVPLAVAGYEFMDWVNGRAARVGNSEF